MSDSYSLRLNRFAGRVTTVLNALAIFVIILAFIALAILSLLFLLMLNEYPHSPLHSSDIALVIPAMIFLGYLLFLIGILSQIILIQSHLEAIRKLLEKNSSVDKRPPDLNIF